MNKNTEKNHFAVIDSLRGIAALLVVIVHISMKLDKSWLTDIASYGQYGVIIFFVISGFIIPYSLYKSEYTLQKMPNFLFRRILRLNPPYYGVLLLTILFYIGVKILHPSADAEHLNISTSRIFFHLTYLVPFVDENWFNNVFWTLAIEFQYYILIAIFYPLLNKNIYWVFLGMTILSFSHYLPLAKTYSTILSYSVPFLLGISIFLYKTRQDKTIRVSNQHMLLLSIFLFLQCKFQMDEVRMLFALFPYLAIMFSQFSSLITNFLGRISYSLYLTHSLFFMIAFPLVEKIISLDRIMFGKEILVVMLFLMSLPIAYAYYVGFEKPSIALAQKIKL
jgi:peptidoglycan/LPS O-acetylase OafA/YrhL